MFISLCQATGKILKVYFKRKYTHVTAYETAATKRLLSRVLAIGL